MKTWILIYMLWGNNTGDIIDVKQMTFNTEQACLDTKQFLKDNLEDDDEQFNNAKEIEPSYIRRFVDATCVMDGAK